MKAICHVGGVALLAVTLSASTVFANPAQDIERAATVSGAGNVSNDSFLLGFGSVLARVKSRYVADYVKAAILLRPDLRSDVLLTALNIRASSNPRVNQSEVTAIVRAAVRNAPGDITALILAAIEAHPDQRVTIATAATSVAPRDAIFQIVSSHSGGLFGTIFGEPRDSVGNHDGDTSVMSPEQAPRSE